MTADPNDLTVEGRVDQIADNLETRAGRDPGAERDDWTLPAMLNRINAAISGGAFEAHLLGDHTDINITSPVSRSLLIFDTASNTWIDDILVASDIPTLAPGSLAGLSDTTISSPVADQFLRYDGAAWINETIEIGDLDNVSATAPSINGILLWNGSIWTTTSTAVTKLPQLSDVLFTSLSIRDFLAYDGANWINFPKANLIWADGTIPLTADWNAGAFKITAEKLRAIRTGSGAFNTIEAELAATGLTGTDVGIYNMVDILVNYEFDDGASLMLPTITGLNMDFNITKTAAALEAGKYRAINIDMDFTTLGVTQPAIILDAVAADSGASFGSAMMTVSVHTLNASGVTALRTEAFVGSGSAGASSSAVGYLGFADGAGTYTGNLVGIRGLTNSSDAANAIHAVLGDPVFLTTAVPNDKIMAFTGYNGNLLINGGSAAISNPGGRFDTLNDITTTHLDFVNNLNEFYVEGNAEIDGTLHCDATGTAIQADGDILILADSKKLFVGAASDAEIYYDGSDLIINPDIVTGGDRVLIGATGDDDLLLNDIEIDGVLNHDGATIGFFGVTPAARASAYTITNALTDRAYDANSTTIDEIADVLGTLIADLKLYGLLQ